jgi:hypothetical protein
VRNGNLLHRVVRRKYIGTRSAAARAQITVDDFVVRESLAVPPDSTGFHNSLNQNESENGWKTAQIEIA